MAALTKALVLRAAGAQAVGSATETGTGVDVGIMGDGEAPRELIVILDVTAAGTDVGDTLDVKIDTKFGSTWVNLGGFTQVLGNGGAKTFAMAIRADNPGASAVFAIGTDATAGATRQIGIGSQLRYRGIQVDADNDGAFDYTVTAYLK